MDLPEVNYTDQYVAFWQRANLPINEVPEAGQKMEMSYEVAMKSLDPHLYQNLMKPDPRKLKADVRSRYEKGIMWTSDLEEYWQKGFTGVAKNIADEMDRARELMEQKNLQEMTERNNKREEAIRNKKPGFGSLPPLSPESIARARAEWGISS